MYDVNEQSEALTDNRDLYQFAKLLINKHGGDGAIDHCDRHIIHHVSERDAEIADVWKELRVAVRQLIDGTPGPEAVVH